MASKFSTRDIFVRKFSSALLEQDFLYLFTYNSPSLTQKKNCQFIFQTPFLKKYFYI